MEISRRQALAGPRQRRSPCDGLFRPAIAQYEPIRIGYLPALTGPSSSTGIGINRGTELAVKEINAAGGIKGRQIELIIRDTQSDPTKAVNASAELTHRQKVSVIWGPVNSGEAAGGDAADRARRRAADPSLLGRCADRPEEIPDGVPQRAHQSADRRRRKPLRGERAQAQEGGGDQRHHGIRHRIGQRLCADAQDDGRRGRLPGQRRAANPDLKPELLRMQAAGARSDHALERECRLPLAHHQYARGRWAGTCRSSARPRSAPARPRPCWKSRSTGRRSIPTISATAATMPPASCRPRTVEFVDRLKRPRSTWAIRCCGGSRSATTGRG